MTSMELQPSPLCILIVTLSTAAVFLLLCHLTASCRRRNPWCSCEVCETYLTVGWSKHHANLCDWYSDLLRRSPTKTVHIHILGNTITANPVNVEYMLKTRFENFPKGKPFSTILGDFLGHGIFNVDGDLWRFQRKMASLEFDGFSIRSFAFDTVRFEIEDRLIPLLLSVSETETRILDLQDVFKRFSFDCICKFSFGLDPMCLQLSLPLSEFALSFDLASNISAERAMKASPSVWKIKRLLNLGSEKKLREAIAMIDVLAQEVIDQKRRIGYSSIHKDLLSRFMRTVNDDKFLRDIIVSFLLAGRDTVASALSSFFWLVAKHPQVASEICEEVSRVIGNQQVTSFEQLRELHYLNAAVYETMRLYPPIQFDSKFCQKDDILPDGTFVKSGTRVTYHPYAMGRMEELWGPDCLEFRPGRWLEEGKFRPENPFKYPIFQAGLRVCLGKEMALMEVKTVALSLLRRFRVELATPAAEKPTGLRFSPGLTATISGGLPVKIRDISTGARASHK